MNCLLTSFWDYILLPEGAIFIEGTKMIKKNTQGQVSVKKVKFYAFIYDI